MQRQLAAAAAHHPVQQSWRPPATSRQEQCKMLRAVIRPCQASSMQLGVSTCCNLRCTPINIKAPTLHIHSVSMQKRTFAAMAKYSWLRWRTAASNPTSETSAREATAARTSSRACSRSCMASDSEAEAEPEAELPPGAAAAAAEAACRASAAATVQRTAATVQRPERSIACTSADKPGTVAAGGMSSAGKAVEQRCSR